MPTLTGMADQDRSDALPEYPRTTERRTTVMREHLVHAWAGHFAVIAKTAREAERMLAQAYEADKSRISQLESYRIDRVVEAYRLRVTVHFSGSGETRTGGVDLLDDPDVRSEPVDGIVIENDASFTDAPTVHVRFGTRVRDEPLAGGAYVKVVGPTREWAEGVRRRLRDEVDKGWRWWSWIQNPNGIFPAGLILGAVISVLFIILGTVVDNPPSAWLSLALAFSAGLWILLVLRKFVLIPFEVLDSAASPRSRKTLGAAVSLAVFVLTVTGWNLSNLLGD